MRNPWAQTGNYRTSYRQDTSIFATHRELVSLLLFLAFLLVLAPVPLSGPRSSSWT
jgi:branched-chain amino acid transport system permease protein